MNLSGAAIKFAEKNGISVPDFVKFLASPAGYTLSKIFDAIEAQTNLPQGILSVAQNPAGAATNYIQTKAQNALFDGNDASKIENIISELQGTNPNTPNFVGPQEENSSVSQTNIANLASYLNSTPSYEATPSYETPSVGPNAEDSQAFQFDISSLPAQLGVQPTPATAVASNTSTTQATNSSSTLPALTPEFLQLILAPPPGVDPNRDAAKELLRDAGIDQPNSSIFGNFTPESLGFTEVQSMPEMQQFYGGGSGGKYYDDFSSQAYAKGGQIYRGRR